MYDDLPGFSDAVAFGDYVRVVGQGEMDNPAFVRGHGFEADGASGVGYAARYPESHVGEGLASAFLVALDVNRKVHPAAELVADDVSDEELERVECFALASYEESGVFAFYIEDEAIEEFVVHSPEVEFCLYAHERYERFDDFGGEIYAVGRRFQGVGRVFEEGDPDFGGFAANAQYAGLAFANDVYFYVSAICV